MKLEMDVTPFVASLEQAGEDTKRACALAVNYYATTAAARISNEYPAAHPRGGKQHTTGQLKSRVYARSGHAYGGYDTGDGMTWTVVSASPISWIYSEGTEARFDSTRQNAPRGRMPQRNVLGRVMSQTRTQLYEHVQRLLLFDRQI